MERAILHCDMNNFYASVETLFRPEFRGKPLAVCGDSELRHGIVLAKSEAAKRLGIKTGDTIWQARQKCPELMLVEPHFDRYVKYSRLAKEIYEDTTDLVEPFGLDECWLDVTGSRRILGDGVTIGNALRERMKKELGLTISVGVSFNKIFAKLGSDMKKPDALTYIPREGFEAIVWPLPVEELFGIGRRMKEDLCRFGLCTIGDLARAESSFLQLRYGKTGLRLKEYAAGLDEAPVVPTRDSPAAKSIGHGLTTKKDLKDPAEVRTLILALMQDVGEKLRREKRLARGVALDCKTASFVTTSLQKRLAVPTDSTRTLSQEAWQLFCERYLFREPLRALTVRAIDLVSADRERQISLFCDEQQEKEDQRERATDAIRRRWGKGAIGPASLLVTERPEEKEGYVPFRGAVEPEK